MFDGKVFVLGVGVICSHTVAQGLAVSDQERGQQLGVPECIAQRRASVYRFGSHLGPASSFSSDSLRDIGSRREN